MQLNTLFRLVLCPPFDLSQSLGRSFANRLAYMKCVVNPFLHWVKLVGSPADSSCRGCDRWLVLDGPNTGTKPTFCKVRAFSLAFILGYLSRLKTCPLWHKSPWCDTVSWLAMRAMWNPFPLWREGQSIPLYSLWVWVMRLGTGQHTPREVRVGARSGCAQTKAVSVQQGQSLLQRQSLVFQECNFFGVFHSKGHLIISAKTVEKELTWLILSAKGRAEPH